MAIKLNNGLVQVFYGNGKGKTTSALGTALRACGSGFSVHLVQFMKNGAESIEDEIPGEIKALEKFPKFTYKRFGVGEWYVKGKNDLIHKNKAREAYNYLLNVTKSSDYDIIIADEILYAVQFSLLSEDDVIQLIKNKSKDVEIILTGSHIAFPKIFALANLVTEIKKIKHPFDLGIPARKGIEF